MPSTSEVDEKWREVGDRLAAARKAKGLSQGEVETLTEATGRKVDRQTVSNYENGKVKRPSFEVLTAIAGAVGLALDLPTTLERDTDEMPGVTAYFTRRPEHERFRAEVNRYLNSSVGDVKESLVRAVVRELEDDEERQS